MGMIQTAYHKRCGALLGAHGFRRTGALYFRPANDVVQSVEFETLPRFGLQRCARILFSVEPLCKGIDQRSLGTGGPHDLKQCMPCDDGIPDGWSYGTTAESVGACVDRIACGMERFLLPYFERADSCAAALGALLQLEETLRQNRLDSCKKLGILPVETDLFGGVLDTNKYYMALKNKDYALALRCRKALLSQNEEAGRKNAACGIAPSAQQAERIAALRAEVARLEAGDSLYFEEQIKANEAYSRSWLDTVFP